MLLSNRLALFVLIFAIFVPTVFASTDLPASTSAQAIADRMLRGEPITAAEKALAYPIILERERNQPPTPPPSTDSYLGPFPGGYGYIDSDEPGLDTTRVRYNWIDISSSGYDITPADPDEGYMPEVLFGGGRTFPFFGNEYSSLNVYANGYITFGTPLPSAWQNQNIPDATSPNAVIAPYWDDLVVEHIKYADGPSGQLIVSWMNAHLYSGLGTGLFNFQVQLYPDGDILCLYQSIGTYNNSGTIGIEDETAQNFVFYSYNRSSTYAGYALMFSKRVNASNPNVADNATLYPYFFMPRWTPPFGTNINTSVDFTLTNNSVSEVSNQHVQGFISMRLNPNQDYTWQVTYPNLMRIGPTWSFHTREAVMVPYNETFSMEGGDYLGSACQEPSISARNWWDYNTTIRPGNACYSYNLNHNYNGVLDNILCLQWLNTTGASNLRFNFDWRYQPGETNENDSLQIVYKLDANSDWIPLLTKEAWGMYETGLSSYGSWATCSIVLPSAVCNQPQVIFGMKPCSAGGGIVYVDNIRVDAPYIRITSPVIGDVIQARTTFNITWESNITGSKYLVTSTDGGLTWPTGRRMNIDQSGVVPYVQLDYVGSSFMYRIVDQTTGLYGETGIIAVTPQSARPVPYSFDFTNSMGNDGWRNLSVRESTYDGWGTSGTPVDRYLAFYSNYTPTHQNDIVWAPPISTYGMSPNIRFDFYYFAQTPAVADTLQIVYSLDDGATWTVIETKVGTATGSNALGVNTLGSPTDPPTSIADWGHYVTGMPQGATNQPAVRIGFKAISHQGPAIFIDNILINTESYHIVTPTVGTVWRAAEPFRLVWSQNGPNPNRLDCSTDDGASWFGVYGLTMTSPFEWIIWDRPSTIGRIRISNTTYNLSATSEQMTFAPAIPVALPFMENCETGNWGLVHGWRPINNDLPGLWNNSYSFTDQNRGMLSNLMHDGAGASNLFWTRPLITTGAAAADVEFDWFYNDAAHSTHDTLYILATNDDGATSEIIGYKYGTGTLFTNLETGYYPDANTTAPPLSAYQHAKYSVPAAYLGQPAVRIGFKSVTPDAIGSILYVDNIQVKVPPFQFTSPIGGEFWQVRTTQSVSWTATGAAPARLEFTTNGGARWNDILIMFDGLTSPRSIYVPDYPGMMSLRLSNEDRSVVSESQSFVALPQTTLPLPFYDNFDHSLSAHGFRIVSSVDQSQTFSRIGITDNYIVEVPISSRPNNGLNDFFWLPPISTLGVSDACIDLRYCATRRNTDVNNDSISLVYSLDDGASWVPFAVKWGNGMAREALYAGTGGSYDMWAAADWGRWKVALPIAARNQAAVRVGLMLSEHSALSDFFIDDVALYQTPNPPGWVNAYPIAAGFGIQWRDSDPSATNNVVGYRLSGVDADFNVLGTIPLVASDVRTFVMGAGNYYYDVGFFGANGETVSADAAIVYNVLTGLSNSPAPVVDSVTCTEAWVYPRNNPFQPNNPSTLTALFNTDTRLFLQPDMSWSSTPYLVTIRSNTRFHLGGLSPSHTYSLRVISYSLDPAQPADTSGQLILMTSAAPLAPTNARFVLPPGGPDNDTLVVTWDDNVVDEESFAIYRATAYEGPYEFAGAVAANQTVFTDHGLTPNTYYSYRIYSFGRGGYSTEYANCFYYTGCSAPDVPGIGNVMYHYLTLTGHNNALQPNPSNTRYYVLFNNYYVTESGILSSDFNQCRKATLDWWSNYFISGISYESSNTIRMVAINHESWECIGLDTVVTMLPRLPLPYLQDFSSATFPPQQWTISNDDAAIGWDRYTGANSNNGCAYVNFYNYMDIGRTDELYSPYFNIVGVSTVYIQFDLSYVAEPGLIDALNLVISYGDSITAHVFVPITLRSDLSGDDSLAGGTGGTRMTPAPTGSWRHIVVPFGNGTLNSKYLRFFFGSQNGYGSNLFIDNVEISSSLAAPSAPTNLRISYAYPNATLTWDASTGSFNNYQVWRYTSGYFTPPSVGTLVGTVPAGTTTFTDPGITVKGFYRVTCHQGASSSSVEPISPTIPVMRLPDKLDESK